MPAETAASTIFDTGTGVGTIVKEVSPFDEISNPFAVIAQLAPLATTGVWALVDPLALLEDKTTLAADLGDEIPVTMDAGLAS